MIRYFYDKQTGSLIALDKESGSARELQSIELGRAPAIEVAAPVATIVDKRKYKKKSAVPQSPGGAWPSHTKKKPAPCGECGSKGFRHFKICSKSGMASKLPSFASSKPIRPDVVSPTAISRMTFGRVKISQSHDIPSATIASNLDIPEAEVEKAFVFETYDGYLGG